MQEKIFVQNKDYQRFNRDQIDIWPLVNHLENRRCIYATNRRANLSYLFQQFAMSKSNGLIKVENEDGFDFIRMKRALEHSNAWQVTDSYWGQG